MSKNAQTKHGPQPTRGDSPQVAELTDTFGNVPGMAAPNPLVFQSRLAQTTPTRETVCQGHLRHSSGRVPFPSDPTKAATAAATAGNSTHHVSSAEAALVRLCHLSDQLAEELVAYRGDDDEDDEDSTDEDEDDNESVNDYDEDDSFGLARPSLLSSSLLTIQTQKDDSEADDTYEDESVTVERREMAPPYAGPWRNVLWRQAAPSVETLEHPLLGGFLPKDLFLQEFGAVLEAMQGETMAEFLDFYFQPDPVDPAALRFCGENERMDFYDWAVELGCSVSVQETCAGEEAEEKERRCRQEADAERARAIQRQKQQLKRESEGAEEWRGEQKKLLARLAALDRIARADKLARARDALAVEYGKFKTNYGKTIECLEKAQLVQNKE